VLPGKTRKRAGSRKAEAVKITGVIGTLIKCSRWVRFPQPLRKSFPLSLEVTPVGNDDAKAAARRAKAERKKVKANGRKRSFRILGKTRKRAGKRQHHPGENG
jgi:hypothetical protein